MKTSVIKFTVLFSIVLLSVQLMAEGDNYNFDLNDIAGIGKVISYLGSDYSISYKGYFELSPDDKKIVKASPGARLEISRSTFGNSRRIEISSNEKGTLTRKYFVGKNEVDYANEGKQWLADILPIIVQKSGVGAEFRVNNIYKTKGISGLLDEINTLDEHSGRVRNLYFVIMIDQLDLNEKDFSKVIPAMEMIHSNSTKGSLLREILYKYELTSPNMVKLLNTAGTLDYNTERGSILRILNPKLIEDDEVMDAYFEVIDDMEIHSEKGNVLKDLLSTRKLKNQSYIRLFESVEEFHLEREKGAVLLHAIEFLPDDQKVLDAFAEVVENLPSKYYVLKGEIMNSLLERTAQSGKSGNKRIILQMLATAEESISNSQKGLALRKVNRMWLSDREVYEAYEDVLESFTDWSETYNVLLDLIKRNTLDADAYKFVFDVTQNLMPDYQHAAGAILRVSIATLPDKEETLSDFFDIVQGMDQNSTIEEVLRLIVTDKRFQNNELVLLKTIESLDNITVDIEKAKILQLIKPSVLKSGEIKYVFKTSVKDIKSDYLLRRVLSE